MRTCAACLFVLAITAPVAAQTADPELRELRLEHVRERQVAGAVLLGWGAANVLAGSVVAIAGNDDDRLVAGGLVSAAFGLANGLLALTLFDLSGSLRAEAREGRYGDEHDPERVRDLALAAQLRTGQTFAVNTGLDAGYVVAGALVFWLGLEIEEDALATAGLVGAAQGLFLLVYDLVEWIASNQRADELLALD